MSSLKQRPEYWRSLAEYENDPEFLEFVQHEFPEPLAELPPNSQERRRFMQLMGASFAFASATGCRWEKDHLLPTTQRQEGVIPGVPRYFNSGFELGGVGVGVRVKSYEGRPIKVDGNPSHPDSGGASGIFEQAGILEMYDPDRSRSPYSAGKPAHPAAFDEFVTKHFEALRTSRGQGLRVLSGTTSSLSFADVKTRFLAAFPEARWVEYEPINLNNVDEGSRLAFGASFRTRLELDKAKVIVTLDADLFSQGPGSIRNGKGFAATREPETGRMSRLYSVEGRMSLTGIMADHRLPLRSGLIKAFAVALHAALGGGAAPAAKFLEEPKVAKFFAALVGDLKQNPGRSVVVAGANQPPAVHALVHAINARIGAPGATLQYFPKTGGETRDSETLKALVQEMETGAVSTLLMLETNPVYTAAGDAPFAAALGKVATSIHAGVFRDETGEKATWHVPLAHYLESWGDVRAIDGTMSIVQPIIAPLFGAKSAIELLATLAADSQTKGLDLLKRALGGTAGDEATWRKSVHDGVVPGTNNVFVQPPLQTLAPVVLTPEELGATELPPGQVELSLVPCSKVYDGRFANNGWLQELPDPVTKLTWDNALLLGPATAEKLGVADSTIVTLTVGNQSITVPALVAPGHAPGSATLALGYGRTAAGRVAGRAEDTEKVSPTGVNAYPLRSSMLWDFGAGAQVKPSGKKLKLATTQDIHAMDQIGREGTQERLPQIVRSATLSEFNEHPDFAAHVVHHPPLLSLWQEPVQYEGRKWGLSVDLNKCTGCNACVVACNAENNISIVGRARVIKGREMHWMRIDRYYKGDPEEPTVVNQPMMCQHCEHAPCEQVCPVGATIHSDEGLNEMTYNRCIGTRYCSNNCPYKVRRFNYFNFNEDMKDERNKVKGMAFNPEVTVRSRGVMEKCSFCVQRIEAVKIVANNEGHRPIKDGEVTTACQDTCPTGAIVFGDMNDASSRVAAKVALPRSYQVLGELNNRPRTRYLATVRNPHPELG